MTAMERLFFASIAVSAWLGTTRNQDFWLWWWVVAGLWRESSSHNSHREDVDEPAFSSLLLVALALLTFIIII